MADISKIVLPNSNEYNVKDMAARGGLANKQDTLVSGTNIKTINNTSLLGSGNINISGGGSDVFIAEYDVTTYAEVLAAIEDEQKIIIKKKESDGESPDVLYYVNKYEIANDNIYLYAIGYNSYISVYIYLDGQWYLGESRFKTEDGSTTKSVINYNVTSFYDIQIKLQFVYDNTDVIPFINDPSYGLGLILSYSHSSTSSQEKIEFTALLDSLSNTLPYKIKYTVTYKNNTGDVTWSRSITQLQSKLVSGTSIKTINNQSLLGSGNLSIPTGDENVQSDWNQVDTTADDYIKNKPASMPASDVYTWAKAATKPTYTAIEVGAQETLVSGTNIKTVNGNSVLGSGDLTISGELQNLVDGSTRGSVRGIRTSAEDSSYTIGEGAFAEGIATKASGVSSHAEGGDTIASGVYSHAEGYNTEANHNAAHAEGLYTTASGEYSHAQNNSTIAAKSAQTAIGKYNIEDTETVEASQKALIIGNGRDIDNRSNALTVDWQGNVDIASGASYKINGTPLSASDVGAQETLVSGMNIKTINNNSLLGSGNISVLNADSTLSAAKLTGAITNGVTATTQSSKDNSTKIATTAYVDRAINDLPEPMIFEGSLGEGGTISTLPTASSTNKGFTYKVITDGTYASQAAKVGDTFISDGTAWVLVPSGDEPSGTVTSIATGAGLIGGPVTSSGTIKANLVSETSQGTIGVTDKLYAVGVDSTGALCALVPWTDTLQNLVDGSAEGSVRGINTAAEDSSYTIGKNAVAEGAATKASGANSHAEGGRTTASGHYSHAEGGRTTASGHYSHAQNLLTIAAKESQTAIGKYNIEDTETTEANQKALIIGNGTDNNNRSNALTVDWTGKIEIALDTSATSGTDKDIYDALVSLGWDSEVIV